ncbi:MAG: RNA methyltransferase [Clostridia bacterium]|nr:RNA methyltransferase [Clostridia bacterium]
MITSKSNELIKYIKSLHQKKYRDEYKKYFVEGIKLVEEAINENMSIDRIIICEEIYVNDANGDGLAKMSILIDKIEYVSKNVFEYISDTKTPQGIMAIINMPDNDKHSGAQYTSKQIEHDICSGAQCAPDNIIFALDNIQDPGNLGTIIRTLDCAGINTLLLSKGTVDLYNPKVIRSTMGAIYRVNIIENLNLKEKLIELKNEGYKIIITDLSAKKYHYELNFDEKLVIVIGNESNGVSQEIKDVADIKIKIPMIGRTESLNAGVAASIIAYARLTRKRMGTKLQI